MNNEVPSVSSNAECNYIAMERIMKLERELKRALVDKENALSDAVQSDVDTLRALHERNIARKQRDEYRAVANELFEMIQNQICLGAFQGAKLQELRSQMEGWADRFSAVEKD
jgi:hypothetical protein